MDLRPEIEIDTDKPAETKRLILWLYKNFHGILTPNELAKSEPRKTRIVPNKKDLTEAKYEFTSDIQSEVDEDIASQK